MGLPGIYRMGEAADAVGLSPRTVRYYRRVGLVVPLARIAIRQYDELGIDPRLEGWLLYTEDNVDRLRLLKPMRPLRFSLEEMKDCLGLRDRLAAGVTDVAQRERMFQRLDAHAREADLRAGPEPHEIGMAKEFAAHVRQLGDRFRRL